MVRAPLHFHGRIPVPEVAPLTYRDGVTHLELVYELSQYLKNILHPSLQSTVDQVVADAEQLLDEANTQYVDGVQEFQRIHDRFMSDVNATLMALNDSAVSDLVDDVTSLLNQTIERVFTLMESTTYRIPTDYPTLQAAVDDLSNKPHTQGATINLLIESRHELREGLIVDNGDYSHFRIISEDTEVLAHNTFTGNMIEGHRATMPVLATVIDMQDRGLDGYHVNNGSTGYIEQYCGIRNAGLRCGYVNMSSRLNALRGVFTGAGETGMWVSRSSNVDAEEADFSGATNEGVMSRRSSNTHIQYSTINDCGQAMIASRGRINAVSVSINRTTQPNVGAVVAEQTGIVTVSRSGTPSEIRNVAGDALLAVSGGTISASLIVIDGCGRSGIRCGDGSRVVAPETVIRNCDGVGVQVFNGGQVSLSKGQVVNSGGAGVDVRRGGGFNGDRCVITNGNGVGLIAYNSTAIELGNATITDNTGEGVYFLQGSNGSVTGATIRNNRSGMDLRLGSGSQMVAQNTMTTNNDVTVDSNINSPNTIVGSVGIMWV